jgi:hypothetical protein
MRYIIAPCTKSGEGVGGRAVSFVKEDGFVNIISDNFWDEIDGTQIY